jgi:hypothetical protein
MQLLRLTLGAICEGLEADDDKRPQEQPEGTVRKDHVDLRCRRALGAHAKCEGGFSPEVSLTT